MSSKGREQESLSSAETLENEDLANRENEEELGMEDEEDEEEEEEDEEDSSGMTSEMSSDEEEDDDTWVTWYCSLKGHEFFCEVDPDYIDDGFNLHGLSDIVPYYNEALDIIMDEEDELDDEFPPESNERLQIERAAELLYGLIHARFILTAQGLEIMHSKYMSKSFGECLRLECEKQPVLPMGLSDSPHEATVKTYCVRCKTVYIPAKERQRSLDGSFWGRTFPHLLCMTYPRLRYSDELPFEYTPRVYGYKIHKSSPYWGIKVGGTISDGEEEEEEEEEEDQSMGEIANGNEEEPSPKQSPVLPTAADINAQRVKVETLAVDTSAKSDFVQAQEAKLEDLQSTLREAVDSGMISPSPSIIEAVENATISSTRGSETGTPPRDIMEASPANPPTPPNN